MATALPAWFAYYAEFVEPQQTTMTAVLQGLPGRATGWFKDTLVFVTDRIAEIIGEFERTKGECPITPDHRVSTLDPKVSRRAGRPPSLLRMGMPFVLRSGGVGPGQMHDPVVRRMIEQLNDSDVMRDANGNRLRASSRDGRAIAPMFPHRRFRQEQRFRELFWQIVAPVVASLNNGTDLWKGMYTAPPVLLPFDYDEALALYERHHVRDSHQDRKFYGARKSGPSANPCHEMDRWQWAFRLISEGQTDVLRQARAEAGRWVVTPQIILGNSLKDVCDPREVKPGDELFARGVILRVIRPLRECVQTVSEVYPDVPHPGDDDRTKKNERSTYSELLDPTTQKLIKTKGRKP